MSRIAPSISCAAVLASLGAAFPALADIAPMNYTTLHSATADFNFILSTVFTTAQGSLAGPLNAYANNNAYSFGPALLCKGGWSCFDAQGLDELSNNINFNPFTVTRGSGVFSYDLEFNSATGGVELFGMQTLANGLWTITDANQQTTVFGGSESVTVANGRYTVAYSGDWEVTQQVTAGKLIVGQAIPAPGAIALLGLAGLAGRRRR